MLSLSAPDPSSPITASYWFGLFRDSSSSSGDENEKCLLDEDHPYYGALVDGKRIDVKRPNGEQPAGVMPTIIHHAID